MIFSIDSSKTGNLVYSVDSIILIPLRCPLLISIAITSAVGIIISSTTSSSIPKTEESIFLYCLGIKSPDSSSKVLSSSVFKLSFNVASFGLSLKILRMYLLIELVKKIRGLKIYISDLRKKEDLAATLSGLMAAIVFGVISENIKITIVRMIDPSKTFPSKYLIIIIVTIADAKIFAKLFPTKIADKS